MIGPGKAFDTDRYFVVSTNLLGGCRGTTGPSSINPATGRPYGADFPVITVADMVRAERAFLDVLGIERLAAVAGGSLGGMQAFEWAVRYPDEVDAIVAIASTPGAAAAGRRVERDRAQRDHGRSRPGRAATTTAPAASRTPAWAWRGWSATSPTCRRSRSATSSAAGCSSPTTSATRCAEPEFEVESYLRHQADAFVKRFDANTYLYTSRALTYFDLARQYGKGSLAEAVRGVAARTLLIAFSSDWLYPPAGSEELAAGAARARQGRRAARHRRAVRPRLLPARRGAPDADDPGLPRPPRLAPQEIDR